MEAGEVPILHKSGAIPKLSYVNIPSLPCIGGRREDDQREHTVLYKVSDRPTRQQPRVPYTNLVRN